MGWEDDGIEDGGLSHWLGSGSEWNGGNPEMLFRNGNTSGHHNPFFSIDLKVHVGGTLV